MVEREVCHEAELGRSPSPMLTAVRSLSVNLIPSARSDCQDWTLSSQESDLRLRQNVPTVRFLTNPPETPDPSHQLVMSVRLILMLTSVAKSGIEDLNPKEERVSLQSENPPQLSLTDPKEGVEETFLLQDQKQSP